MSIAELYRNTGPASTPSSTTEKKPAVSSDKKTEFHELLQKEALPESKDSSQAQATSAPKLNFSQHAETRIRSRAIEWNPNLEKRISAGIDAAQAKGSRETLILADEIAVIANVKSRTVITAMDRTQLRERIFTNIDSTVLV